MEVYAPEVEEAVRRAHNDAFADHWGAIPKTQERWADQQASRSFRPTMRRIILSTDTGLDSAERVDGYALCGEWVESELTVALRYQTPRPAPWPGRCALAFGRGGSGTWRIPDG